MTSEFIDFADLPRKSGVLLHPTSLPGRSGIGELDDHALRFVDFLVESAQGLWQVLPLSPATYEEDCPYSSFSAIAGNPMLVSLDRLVELGLLNAKQLEVLAHGSAMSSDQVDFRRVRSQKWPLLRTAFRAFEALGKGALDGEYHSFCSRSADWLDDYALFMALHDAHDGRPWNQWEPALAQREPNALEAARVRLRDDIAFYKFLQWSFARQWDAVRRYANERGVQLVGDVPIYVGHNSADVWAHPEYFHLDAATGAPSLLAGASPDPFFTDEGQIWGNPVYRWDALAASGYRWWIRRFERYFEQFDWVRVDHFRGFEAFWVVKPGEPSARTGHFLPGPGRALFDAVRAALGQLPMIIEDLGYITPEVHEMREALGLPAMFVLHFAFDSGPDNPYLPHKTSPRSVIYTGTHDTDTSRGWFANLPEHAGRAVLDCLGVRGSGVIEWDLMRLAHESSANWAIVPLQDVLGLGSEARMNVPGKSLAANWAWRFREGALRPEHAEKLAALTRESRRV